MSLNVTWADTHAFAVSDYSENGVFGDGSNPSLLRNWASHVAFGMMLTGIGHITTENLPTFITRYNVLEAASGLNTIGFDPDVYECFVGARANVIDESDAVFFRRMAKTAKGTADDYRRRWEGRKPGDVLNNMKLESLAKGECQTCASHHTQDVVHDGEKN